MKTLYQLKKTGKLWQWSVRARGSHVITTYGYVDGILQETTETALAMNVGRSNEVVPEEQAKLIMERKIQAKLDNGYSESPKEAKLEPEGLDYDNLPKSFTPAKPISSIDEAKLRELFDAERLCIQRKWDGMCIVLSKGQSLHFLTRGKLEDKTDHFPHIMSELKDLPEGTILVGELVASRQGADNFKYVTSIVRTKASEEAIAKQSKDGYLYYIIFDVLHWAGEDITALPYRDRMSLLNAWDKQYSGTPENLKGSYDELFGKKGIISKNGWEGLVVHDSNAGTEIRLDGKEARLGMWKYKKIHTEDCWLEDPEQGKGRNENRLGKCKGYQYSPTGEKIYIGDVGGGYSDQERDAFWQRRKGLFPCAAEVETSERLVSMKLRFPVFIRLRPDKSEKECIIQLIPKTESEE